MFDDEDDVSRRGRSRAHDEGPSRDDDAGVTRVWRRPRTGTKVTTLAALAFLACAVYFLLAPVYMDTASGWFGCGNALTGTDDDFTSNVCGGAPSLNRARAVLMVAIALLVGGVGAWLFGFDRETETRSAPPRRREGRGARSTTDGRGARGAGGRPERGDRDRSIWDA